MLSEVCISCVAYVTMATKPNQKQPSFLSPKTPEFAQTKRLRVSVFVQQASENLSALMTQFCLLINVYSNLKQFKYYSYAILLIFFCSYLSINSHNSLSIYLFTKLMQPIFADPL